MPSPAATHFDAIILGGGIAGLWTLARLRHEGFAAALLESRALGSGQTLWSQGIIHGGIKYALTGQASAASRAIADMPAIWADCLAGKGSGPGAGIDLSAVTPLAREQHLWTTPGIASRLAGIGARAAIRTAVEHLPRDRWPPAFALAPRGIDLYRVAEPVLPGPALVHALATPHAGAIGLIRQATAITHDAHGVTIDCLAPDGSPRRFASRLLICLAGAGNADLARLAGFPSADRLMQRRPLHMLYARAPKPADPRDPNTPGPHPRLFGHCLAASTLPRLTITTIDEPDARVYYLGGAIAESGVARDEPAQLDAARAELAACAPWIDQSALAWGAGRIDRAEGLTPAGTRPDEPVLHRHGPVLLGWPTKLAFAPALAQRVLDALREGSPALPAPGTHPQQPLDLPAPTLARPPWADVPLA